MSRKIYLLSRMAFLLAPPTLSSRAIAIGPSSFKGSTKPCTSLPLLPDTFIGPIKDLSGSCSIFLFISLTQHRLAFLVLFVRFITKSTREVSVNCSFANISTGHHVRVSIAHGLHFCVRKFSRYHRLCFLTKYSAMCLEITYSVDKFFTRKDD